MQKITPFFWFDTQAEEAVKFYAGLFPQSIIGSVSHYTDEGQEIHGMPAGSVLTLNFELAGQPFTALNGGPHFSFNPSISFFVTCETEQETDKLWSELAEKGEVLFPLKKYEWSEKYGWLNDRYGLSWQISLGSIDDVGQKITPSLLFVNDMLGKGEEAINHYASIFKPSEIDGILKYGPGEEGPEGAVKHAQFALSGGKFMVMDGPGNHDFSFNEAVSFVVHCKTSDEVDYYWEKLGKDGDPQARQCGWLKDKFGVSWQVVPDKLFEMLNDSNPEKVKHVTKVMLQMKKLDLAELQKAYNSVGNQ
jgi:predicted 3-demethylubiquinone-9 3-methyltransferase (glyoxalase superfamily)